MAYNGRKTSDGMDVRLLRARCHKTPYNDPGKRDDDTKGKESAHREKPLLVRMYDAIAPSRHGGYTEEQDHRHSVVSFMVSFVIVVTVATSVCLLVRNYQSYRADHILVPAVTFTNDQAGDVMRSLADMGFVDVIYVEGKGVYAHGTKGMCDEWRSSFREKNVDDAMSKVGKSFVASGIVGSSVSDDGKALTISTLTADRSVDVIGYIVTSDREVKAMVDGLAEWCAVLNDGDALHVSFVDSDGKEYLSIDATSSSNLVSQMQSKDDDGDDVHGVTDDGNDSNGDVTDGTGADDAND